MITNLPEVKVKKEYRGKYYIRWNNNPGSNFIIDSCFRHKDFKVPGPNGRIIEFHNQVMSMESRKQFDIDVGNIPTLTEWTDFLHSYEANVNQPWFYSIYTNDSFPSYMNKNHPTHVYNIDPRLSKMICMGKKNEDGDITLMKFDSDIVECPRKISDPQLVIDLAILYEDEVENKKCEDIQSRYLINIVENSHGDKKKPGEVINFSIKDDDRVRAVVFCAENTVNETYNIYNNYTTNSFNKDNGLNSFSSVNVDCRQCSGDKLPITTYERSNFRNYSLRTPIDKGYNLISFCTDMLSHDWDKVIIPSQDPINIKCHLSEIILGPPPISESSFVNEDKVHLFEGHYFLLIIHKLEITKVKDENEFIFNLS
jgi:hypothetical protein